MVTTNPGFMLQRNTAIVNDMIAAVWTFLENGVADFDIFILLNTLLRQCNIYM